MKKEVETNVFYLNTFFSLTEFLEEGIKVVALLELVGAVQLNHGEGLV